jgi:nucleoside-diphosphate-sugar epimerase
MLPFLLVKQALAKKSFHQFGDNDTNRRDWTFIDDFVAMVSKVAASPYTGFELINIGSGLPIGIADFIQLCNLPMQKYFKCKVEVVVASKPDTEMDLTYADSTKLQALVGAFKPTDIKVGLDATFKYFAKNRAIYFGDDV